MIILEEYAGDWVGDGRAAMSPHTFLKRERKGFMNDGGAQQKTKKNRATSDDYALQIG